MSYWDKFSKTRASWQAALRGRGSKGAPAAHKKS
jgi:hypothetical protein